nr:hypothetical protein [Candidatus Sigynarchaeota archaeon]
MQFCPKCDNVLLIKKKKGKPVSSGKKKSKKDESDVSKILYCSSCGFEAPFDEEHKELYTLSVKLDHSQKDKTLVLGAGDEALKVSEEEREANEDFFQQELEE